MPRTLPNNWHKEELGTICAIKTGKKDVNQGAVDGKYPFFTCSKQIHRSDEYSFDTEAILIAGNGAVGDTKYYKGKFEAYQRTYVLDGFREYTKFIFFFLLGTLSEELSKRVSGSTMPYIRKGDLSRISIPIPPLLEQRRVAAVLSLVQRAIEQQEQMIALTNELKKALMHKFFTEGTRGEPQKQTEIGPIPKSWELFEMVTLFSVSPNNGLYKPNNLYGTGTLILRIDDFSNDGDIVLTAANRLQTEKEDLRRFGLSEGDIVVNRVNSLSHLGKTALIGPLAEPMLFESNMMRFRIDETKAIPEYVFRFFNSPLCKKQILGSAKRAVAQSSINQGDISSFLIPLPTLEVQGEILEAVNCLVRKSIGHNQRKRSLQDLFFTLLHQLMTAEIQVNDLDLSELGLGVQKAGVINGGKHDEQACALP